MFSNQVTVKVGGNEITAYRVNNDINGNPRYVISWLSVPGAESYEEAIKIAKDKIGGKRYRGKDFGGGIVFQSYALENDLRLLFEK